MRIPTLCRRRCRCLRWEEIRKQLFTIADVIEKVTEKVPTVVRRTVDKDVDRIVYSYTKFNELDHRIKLFIYAHLFDDVEQFQFLLRVSLNMSLGSRVVTGR